MHTGGSGSDKRSEHPGDASQAAAIADLPSNATQPGGPPKGTEEPGDSDAKGPKPSDRLPPAGPHADPALMNPDATPGTGALTPPGEHGDSDSTSG